MLRRVASASSSAVGGFGGQGAQQRQHAGAVHLKRVDPPHQQVEQPVAHRPFRRRLGQGRLIDQPAEAEQDRRHGWGSARGHVPGAGRRRARRRPPRLDASPAPPPTGTRQRSARRQMQHRPWPHHGSWAPAWPPVPLWPTISPEGARLSQGPSGRAIAQLVEAKCGTHVRAERLRPRSAECGRNSARNHPGIATTQALDIWPRRLMRRTDWQTTILARRVQLDPGDADARTAGARQHERRSGQATPDDGRRPYQASQGNPGERPAVRAVG